MIRAIYTPDLNFSVCHVYEYDTATGHFHMLTDASVSFPYDTVLKDKEFLLFMATGETAHQVTVGTGEATSPKVT